MINFISFDSCIALQSDISVGSSGAVLGMLCSWIVWIIFRWNKIPARAHANRNCQLFIVFACVVITIGTSFGNYVDWCAHVGGVIMVSYFFRLCLNLFAKFKFFRVH